VGGVGTAEGLTDWCKPYWDDSGLKVKADAIGPGNSDHAAFYDKKVPDLFFFTGYHPEYHTPKDVVSLINFEGGAKVADLVGRMAIDAAQRTEPFPFTAGDAPSVGPTNVPVRFGIMADYGYDEKPGVKIDHLSSDKGLPAELAGFKAGDLMTKWDGVDLKDVTNWMKVMSKYKPGDKVKITYIRDGKEQTAEATLVAPSGQHQ
jgi:predicted metalloprotease with PDZ domain